MRVKCERDNTEWGAFPMPYPAEGRQTTFYNEEGDMFLDCPTCCRRYFLYDAKHLTGREKSVAGRTPVAGDYFSDRILTVLIPPQGNGEKERENGNN